MRANKTTLSENIISFLILVFVPGGFLIWIYLYLYNNGYITKNGVKNANDKTN